MLCYLPKDRITANDALKHPYFSAYTYVKPQVVTSIAIDVKKLEEMYSDYAFSICFDRIILNSIGIVHSEHIKYHELFKRYLLTNPTIIVSHSEILTSCRFLSSKLYDKKAIVLKHSPDRQLMARIEEIQQDIVSRLNWDLI